MSDVKMDKRRYHSPLRQEQALATRARILDAALERFATHGYAATSIAAIARVAGVVPETIYATFGSKRAIVDSLIERAHPDEAAIRIQAEWTAASASPAAQLRTLAHGARAFWEANERVAAIVRHGTGDADIGGIWAERSAARRALFGRLLDGWDGRILAPSLSRDEAADIAWSLASDESYRSLVVDRGWTPDRWEAWLGDALRGLLLAP